MTSYKRPESVLVVVCDFEKQILLLRRKDDPSFWQSVTGSLSEGEAPFEGAKRELFEETGLTTLEDGELIDCQTKWWFTIYKKWQYRYPPGTQMNLEHVFVFKTNQKNILMSQEHTEHLWFTKDEALKKVSSMTNFRAIKTFIT